VSNGGHELSRKGAFIDSSAARVALLLALPFVIYFLFAVGGKALKSYQLQEDESALRAEIARLTARNAELQAQREYFQTDAYIEQIAREQLGMVKKSETSYVILAPEAPATQAQQQTRPADTRTRPQRWWDLFFGPR